jgi:uncharacterized protein (DUF1697 family)
MAVMVAFLRGVNVGNNILRMERLREFCAEIGMQNVRTYVQSGNVIFDADGGVTHWADKIQKRLLGETRLPVTVIVRTPADLKRTLGQNPFLKECGMEVARLHVAMLAKVPAKSALKSLAAQTDRYCGGDRYILSGRDIYLHCPNGYGQSKLTNGLFEKFLDVRATTRNWNTLNNILDMVRE